MDYSLLLAEATPELEPTDENRSPCHEKRCELVSFVSLVFVLLFTFVRHAGDRCFARKRMDFALQMERCVIEHCIVMVLS